MDEKTGEGDKSKGHSFNEIAGAVIGAREAGKEVTPELEEAFIKSGKMVGYEIAKGLGLNEEEAVTFGELYSNHADVISRIPKKDLERDPKGPRTPEEAKMIAFLIERIK